MLDPRQLPGDFITDHIALAAAAVHDGNPLDLGAAVPASDCLAYRVLTSGRTDEDADTVARSVGGARAV